MQYLLIKNFIVLKTSTKPVKIPVKAYQFLGFALHIFLRLIHVCIMPFLDSASDFLLLLHFLLPGFQFVCVCVVICCVWRHHCYFGSFFGYWISFIPPMNVLCQVKTVVGCNALGVCNMQNWQENWRTKRNVHPVAAREIAKSNLVQFVWSILWSSTTQTT